MTSALFNKTQTLKMKCSDIINIKESEMGTKDKVAKVGLEPTIFGL